MTVRNTTHGGMTYNQAKMQLIAFAPWMKKRHKIIKATKDGIECGYVLQLKTQGRK
jgi:hypothetical protein